MKEGICLYTRPNICYGGGGGGGLGNILGDAVDVGTAIFAPEALPLVAPAVGAVTGGLSGGGKGALLGGLEGGLLGQLGGTGPLAIGASDTGGSLINQAIGGIGSLFGGLGTEAAGAGATTGGIPSVIGGSVLGDVAGGSGTSSLGAVPTTPALTAGPGGLGAPLGDLSGGGYTFGGPASLGSGLNLDPATGLAATTAGAAPDITFNSGVPGVAGAAGTPAAAATTAGGPLSGISNFIKNNPLLTLGGGFLGSQLLSPQLQKLSGVNTPTPTEQNLINANAPATAAANALIPSEQTGILPPGAQQSVTNALNANIANIKSRYAALGDSGSSAEQQDIANAQNQAVALSFSLAQQATQTGLSALGLEQGAYTQLLQDQLNRQQQLSNATSNFFSSLGLGTALGSAKTA